MIPPYSPFFCHFLAFLAISTPSPAHLHTEPLAQGMSYAVQIQAPTANPMQMPPMHPLPVAHQVYFASQPSAQQPTQMVPVTMSGACAGGPGRGRYTPHTQIGVHDFRPPMMLGGGIGRVQRQRPQQMVMRELFRGGQVNTQPTMQPLQWAPGIPQKQMWGPLWAPAPANPATSQPASTARVLMARVIPPARRARTAEPVPAGPAAGGVDKKTDTAARSDVLKKMRPPSRSTQQGDRGAFHANHRGAAGQPPPRGLMSVAGSADAGQLGVATAHQSGPTMAAAAAATFGPNTSDAVASCTFDGCQQTFTELSQLRKHVFGHAGERRFSCTVCTQSFRTKWTLKKHFRTHTGERPFSCADCEISFTQRASWRRHIFANHRKDVETRMDCEMFRCNRCLKCFKIKKNFKRHLTTHQHDDDDGDGDDDAGSAMSRPPTATPTSIREGGVITPTARPAPSPRAPSIREEGVITPTARPAPSPRAPSSSPESCADALLSLSA